MHGNAMIYFSNFINSPFFSLFMCLCSDNSSLLMRPRNTEKLNTKCLPRKRNETQDVVANCQVSGPEVCALGLQEEIFFFFNEFFFLIYFLFIYLWLCWVFVSVRGLSPVAASGGHSSSRCAGLSLLRPLLLQNTGSRRAGSVVVAHRLNCSAACGIFPDQGSNPCPLHWQADSQPLHHQGSPQW